MENNELPAGWVWTRLGDLALNPRNDIVDGPFGSNLKASEYEAKGIPIIRLQNISRNHFVKKNIRFIKPEKAEQLKRHSFSKGDIVITKLGAPLGEACIIPEDIEYGIIVADVVRARTDDRLVSKKYLIYCINSESVIKQFEIKTKGTTRPRVNLNHIRELELPLPPLPEQRRIVTKLEELFTRLDAGVSALKKTQAQLKRYRQAVLNYAFEGKLTEDWRVANKNEIEPASLLLEHIKEETKKDSKRKIKELPRSDTSMLPEGWVYGKLEHLIYIAGRIGWRGLKAEEYTKEGPLFLSVYNLNKGNYVDFSDVYHISDERYDESPEIQLKDDDILLVKDGSGIGKLGIVKGLKTEATVNSSLLVIRSGKFFVPEYLFYFLKGPNMQRVVKERITGSATPHLFQRDIKKFELLIPSIKEQEKIVEEIERHLSIADEVAKTVEQSLAQAERLRQSILKKAFEGRLVAQDASDEPAGVLLERIKTEKARMGKNKQKSRVTKDL